YAALAGQGSPFPGNVKWNFEKFLVGRDGKVLARFPADTEPDARDILTAIESALAAK
ncbi:MAG: glutathione peroxidase, partial [Opitutaceae bacterium]